jgi:hypothetical protein
MATSMKDEEREKNAKRGGSRSKITPGSKGESEMSRAGRRRRGEELVVGGSAGEETPPSVCLLSCPCWLWPSPLPRYESGRY